MTPSPLDTNNATLAAYEHDIDGYIKSTPNNYDASHAPLLKWLNYTLSLIPKQSRIFEVGSGLGRDARYIQAKGYNIVCSDAANIFIKYLRTWSLPVQKFNIVKDPLPQGYNLIFANAVIPHLNEAEAETAMRKIFQTLEPGSFFALSAKEGVGNIWTDEKLKEKRFIHYWDTEDLIRLAKLIGFEVVYTAHGIPGDLGSHTWTHLTLKK